jgi:hypothetical protein
MTGKARVGAAVALVVGALTIAQTVPRGQAGKIASPEGVASTEIRGRYLNAQEPTYEGGKWIEIKYGRPIKRGRDLWGSGASYGANLNAGAPVWRAGANVSTRLKTELPLVMNGKTIPVGEYSLFIDLKPANWTLIVSRWAAQTEYNPGNRAALWGSFDYTPDKDVVRAPMKLETLPHSVDQLTWEFLDMSNAGGVMAIEWDKTMASVPFTVAQ